MIPTVPTFDITTSGEAAGADVAQVYVSPSKSSVTDALEAVKGFQKVVFQPGETKHVSIDLDARAFAYYDVAAKSWSITPGRFGVLVGNSSATLPLKDELTVSQVTASKANFR